MLFLPSRVLVSGDDADLMGTYLFAGEANVSLSNRKVQCLGKSFDREFAPARDLPVFVEPRVLH
jgi:hypothetical protein